MNGRVFFQNISYTLDFSTENCDRKFTIVDRIIKNSLL
ncbi:hypothetical protein P689_122254 [Candidatus Riesia pediculischaeffi PTSU]|uniref:Uncharacterized protein n=1 Tax=Candidatus Riesia pediculischaeffi PTSU TaxID=1401651 RepID=A0A0C1RZQ2_9ENTR|nr:hypothetical protein P689_122254 [Candidatus Riesia pediculischaeffi PTSU]